LNDTDLAVVDEKLAHLQQQKALRGQHRERVRREIEALGGEIKTLERSLGEVSEWSNVGCP
jgi:hypothetical protein